MTVIVGIYCKDGIVIAADSALSNGSFEQTYEKKLACDNDSNIIVGFAGDLWFAQRYRQVVKDFWNTSTIKDLEKQETHEVTKEFCKRGILEFFSTQKANADILIPTDIILGFVHKNNHHLIIMPGKGFQPLVINENLPYCSLGSGHYITNPFLSFVKDVFWKNPIPTVSVGVFSAIMALKLAIKVNPGGINEPIHVAVIQKNPDNTYACKKLHTDDISQHEENYKAALEYFSSYTHAFDKASIAAAADVPTPPK